MPNEKSKEKLEKSLQEIQTNPDKLFSLNQGDHGHYMPEHQQAMAELTARTSQYLNSLRPNPTRNSPLDPEPVISAQDKAKYDQALSLAEQPLSILSHIKDGTLTSSHMVHMQNLYPTLLGRIRQEMLDKTVDHISDGNEIPYHQKMALSKFMGQPLETSMTPQSIQTIQGALTGGVMQQQAAQQMPKQKRNQTGLNKLGKISSLEQTGSQARQAMKATV
jgi:hypothetical protein